MKSSRTLLCVVAKNVPVSLVENLFCLRLGGSPCGCLIIDLVRTSARRAGHPQSLKEPLTEHGADGHIPTNSPREWQPCFGRRPDVFENERVFRTSATFNTSDFD
jgi:hypothetical protein